FPSTTLFRSVLALADLASRDPRLKRAYVDPILREHVGRGQPFRVLACRVFDGQRQLVAVHVLDGTFTLRAAEPVALVLLAAVVATFALAPVLPQRGPALEARGTTVRAVASVQQALTSRLGLCDVVGHLVGTQESQVAVLVGAQAPADAREQVVHRSRHRGTQVGRLVPLVADHVLP